MISRGFPHFTVPAGRYLSYLVTDLHGKQVLSIDHAALISMHMVAKGTPAQRRAAHGVGPICCRTQYPHDNRSLLK